MVLHRLLRDVELFLVSGVCGVPSEYDVSAIALAVHQLEYHEMGSLVSELYVWWDRDGFDWGPSFAFNFSDFDHTNGFDEFIVTLFVHWAECVGLLVDHCVQLDRLSVLLVETA